MYKKIFQGGFFMKKKQYGAPEVTLLIIWTDDVMNVSLGAGEKGVWDDEIFN